MTKIIYVVMGTSGEYSDRTEWPILAYENMPDAIKHVEQATTKQNEIRLQKQLVINSEIYKKLYSAMCTWLPKDKPKEHQEYQNFCKKMSLIIGYNDFDASEPNIIENNEDDFDGGSYFSEYADEISYFVMEVRMA